MDYNKNLIYFKYAGKSDIVFRIVTVVIFILLYSVSMKNQSGKPEEQETVLVGAIALSALIYYGYIYRKFMTDAQYDSVVRNEIDIQALKDYVLEKFAVDESEVNEVAPIVLRGYVFDGADKIKQGKDGKWRSNIYKLVMLLFSRNEMLTYATKLKTTANEELEEETSAYFYRDIVSVSTISKNEKVKIGKEEKIISSEVFMLTTKGGTSITVNLEEAGQYQQSVKAMRALLREKKQA